MCVCVFTLFGHVGPCGDVFVAVPNEGLNSQVCIASGCDLFPDVANLSELLGEGVSPSFAATDACFIDGWVVESHRCKGTDWDSFGAKQKKSRCI